MARRTQSDIRVSASDALEFEPAETPKRGLSTTVWLLIVLVLVTGAGAGGFLFGDTLSGLDSSEPSIPIVHAEPGPIKGRPKNPGGEVIPDRDKTVYQRFSGEPASTRVENLLPPPEKPLDPPRPEAAPGGEPASSSAGGQGAAAARPGILTPPKKSGAPLALVPGAKPAPEASKPAAGESLLPPPAPPLTAANKPKVDQPVSAAELKKAGVAPPAAQSASQPKPKPQVQSSTTPPSAPKTAPQKALKETAEAAAKKPATAPKPAQKQTPKAPKVAQARLGTASPRPSPKPSASGKSTSYQVQLAAARSAQAAQGEWDRLRAKHRDLLGPLGLTVVRADLGAGKGVFYRLRVGPVTDRNAARALCSALSKRKQACLIVPPGK